MTPPDKIKESGGPAFPVIIPGRGGNGWQGMTLRDWFAGQALAGMLGDPERRGSAKDFSHYAYEMADAMLAKREG